MTIRKAIKRFQGWLDEGYYKINRQDSDWSEDKAALELAIQCMNDTRPKGGKWKLVKRGPFIDIVCADCGYVKFTGYAYNRKPDEVLTYLKTKDTDRLPAYCEGCGAQMKGVTK